MIFRGEYEHRPTSKVMDICFTVKTIHSSLSRVFDFYLESFGLRCAVF